MSEEIKNCPICNCAGSVLEPESDYYEADDAIRCCNACDFYCSEKHWNKLPRLDEKRKAKIALEVFKEFDKSVPPAKNTKKDWDRLINWLDEKAKGWE